MPWPVSSALSLRRQAVARSSSTEIAPDVGDLWAAAIDQYRHSLGVDLQDPSISFFDDIRLCSTTDEILDMLHDASEYLHDKRHGSRTSRALRDALKPVVHGLIAILDVGAEGASSSGVPGGKSIFVAIAVLLKAADKVSAAYDDLEKLFERLGVYVDRLRARVQAPMRSGAREIAVKALVEMLKAIALSTKMLRKGRIELFLRAVFTKSNEVRSAIEDLEVIVSDEERMAVTDVVVGMHELSSQVLDVSTTMSRLVEVSNGTAETIQVMVDEIRGNERQRTSDNEAVLAFLGAIAGNMGMTIHYEGPPSGRSHLPSLTHEYPRQQIKQVPRLQPAHEDTIHQLIPSRSTGNHNLEAIRQLRSAVSRFAIDDQDIIYRIASTLFSWALEAVNSRYSAATSAVATTHTSVHWLVVETFLPLICTFLVLFMMFKLGSVTRNLGFPPETVIVIGLRDEIFVLDSETFSSWENTHAFLLRAFQGRLGVSYVEKRDYALGNSEHLFIERHRWSVIVKAGSQLHMSVVIHGNGTRCPYCGTISDSGNESDSDEHLLCSRCGRLYGALQGTFVEDENYPFSRPSAPVPGSYENDDNVVPTVGPFHRVIVALDVKDVPVFQSKRGQQRPESLSFGELQKTSSSSDARVAASVESRAGDHNTTEGTHAPAIPSHLFSEPSPSKDSRLPLQAIRRRPAMTLRANTAFMSSTPLLALSIDEEEAGDVEMMQFIEREQAKKLAHGVTQEELDVLSQFPNPTPPVSATSPLLILHSSQRNQLSDYEQQEILEYPSVYFFGGSGKNPAHPDRPLNNFGYDDERGNYLAVNGDHLAYRYEVVDTLGMGLFGRVLSCRDHCTGQMVAIKIVRNKKRMHHQALVEINILDKLRQWDREDKHHVIRMTEHFYFRHHLCIGMELLSINLYELIKANGFVGFTTTLIRRFTNQILDSLVFLRRHRIIHCDLKPENILLQHPAKSAVKVIDFSSSCFEHEKIYTYIQSCFYRSPEVILGMNYQMAIDMWALGCILVELKTGFPIFPGENEQEQLACIMEVLGVPDKDFVARSSRKCLFFDSTGAPRPVVNSKGRLRRPGTKQLARVLRTDDELFVDFIAKCFIWDPERRMKPQAALKHPFMLAGKQSSYIPHTPSRQPVTRPNASAIGTPGRIFIC